MGALKERRKGGRKRDAEYEVGEGSRKTKEKNQEGVGG